MQSTDGTILQIPPGALPEGVTVSLESLPLPPAEELPAAEVFTAGSLFEIDLSGAKLSEPAQLAVPLGPEFQAGDTVYFFQKQSVTDQDGVAHDIWLLIDTGNVGSDGIGRTASPPYPGFSAGGQYLAAKADEPNKLVQIGTGAPPHVGYSIGVDWNLGIGIGIGFGLMPFFPTLSISITVLTYSRHPNEIPVAQQVVSIQNPTPGTVYNAEVTLPEIDPDDLKPIIHNVELVSLSPARIRVTGERFEDANVVFRIGSTDFVSAAAQSDTEAIVAIPAGVIVGVSDILLMHAEYGESNRARLNASGNLAPWLKPAGESRSSARRRTTTRSFASTILPEALTRFSRPI